MNIYFKEYVLETQNYFLLYLPLTHEYIYEDNIVVGFVSKLFSIIIAVYVLPTYRNKKIMKNYFKTTDSKYIVTNNRLVNFLNKNNFKNIINIPFFRLFVIQKLTQNES